MLSTIKKLFSWEWLKKSTPEKPDAPIISLDSKEVNDYEDNRYVSMRKSVKEKIFKNFSPPQEKLEFKLPPFRRN